MSWFFRIFMLALLCLAGCATDHGPRTNAKLDWISVSKDGQGFVQQTSGKPFRPWGFNYDRDYRMRLLEEYWGPEWATVAEDFREMKRLGANTVRIHLQFHEFMSGPATPNPAALTNLGKLVGLAEKTGLYLDITGLACYRKTATPGWYDSMSEQERWKAQGVFWSAIARTCRSSPAVICYNLMNEPFVPNGKLPAGQWLSGELAGFSYVQSITLDPSGRERAEIAAAWARQLVAAIRGQDRGHLITIGLLPNSGVAGPGGSGFLPLALTNSLDYLSVHVYPRSDELASEVKVLHQFRTGKPLVVEECFPINCRESEMVQFMELARGDVAGWISFYWGQTPEELDKLGTIQAALTRSWLRSFAKSRDELGL